MLVSDEYEPESDSELCEEEPELDLSLRLAERLLRRASLLARVEAAFPVAAAEVPKRCTLCFADFLVATESPESSTAVRFTDFPVAPEPPG